MYALITTARTAAALPPDLADQLGAAHAGEAVVGHQDAGTVGDRLRQRFLGAGRDLGRVAAHRQDLRDVLREVLVVVDDQHGLVVMASGLARQTMTQARSGTRSQMPKRADHRAPRAGTQSLRASPYGRALDAASSWNGRCSCERLGGSHERRRVTDLIVCATDFSPEAASALEWAVGFARREGGRIDLVHVLPEPTHNREQLATDAATFEAARLHDARARLGQVAAEAARTAGVVVQPQILIGDTHVRIVEHARGHQARLIVMGASGRPAIDRWVLGSAAERTVSRRACRWPSCPVTTGRRPGSRRGRRESARPFKALVGLEGDDFPELVTFAAGLRRRGACDVTFLHFYWPIEEYQRLGLRGPAIRSRPIRRS